MGRLIGIGTGLLAVLTVIWFCCGNGVPSALAGQKAELPQFTSQPAATEPAQGPVQPPQLEIGELICYDSADTGLQGVAALLLHNSGELPVARAEVAVFQDSRELRFAVGYIPPGGTVLAEEKNRMLYTEGLVTGTKLISLVALETYLDTRVLVEESGEFELTLTNLTDEVLGDIRVFYKRYDAAEDRYIGGVTYSLIVPQLLPGQSRRVWPYLYVREQMKVVAVTIGK